jgi:hypothetical protein
MKTSVESLANKVKIEYRDQRLSRICFSHAKAKEKILTKCKQSMQAL